MISFIKNIFKKKDPTILPRIKHKNFVEAIKQIPEFDRSDMPLTHGLIGDLILAFAIDDGSSYRMMTKKDIVELGMSENNLRQIAYGNGLIEMSKTEIATDGKIQQVSVDNNMSACSILYPDFWDDIMGKIGGPIMAIFPHRDAVFFGISSDATKLALNEVLKQIDADDNHNLTMNIFERKNKTSSKELDFSKSWPHNIEGWKIIQ